MKRYLFVCFFLLFFIMMCHIGSATEGTPKEAVVTGYAYGDKPIEKLREEALLDAFKKAARQVVGTYVSSYTQVKMFKLVDQSITTRTEAYIEKYNILEEYKEFDQYVVKARVSVNAARLYDDLDLKDIMRRLEKLEKEYPIAGTFEITPYGGVLFGDSPGEETISGVKFEYGDMDNAASFGVRLAYNITSSVGIEGTVGWVNGSDFDTEVTYGLASTEFSTYCDQSYFHGNIVYNISLGEFVPYLTAGLGAVHFSGADLSAYDVTIKGWDETNFAWNFGGGTKWLISNFMAIRIDVRGIITSMENLATMNMIETTGGLSFIF